MFGDLNKTSDFGFPSVTTSTDQFVHKSNCEGFIQFDNNLTTSFCKDVWYTPQQLVSSPTFPFFKHPHLQCLPNSCINEGFILNNAANNYLPNFCPQVQDKI